MLQQNNLILNVNKNVKFGSKKGLNRHNIKQPDSKR
jgi:hypothetical protein